MKLVLNKEYKLRHLAVAALLGAVGLWFFYDGLVAWPEENRRWREEQIAREVLPETLENEKPPHPDHKIGEQLVFGGVLDGVALLISILLAREALKTLEWDFGKATMKGSMTGGREVPFTEIKDMDLRQWRTKRIARVSLKDGRRMTLDAWHHANAADLVRHFRDTLKIPFED